VTRRQTILVLALAVAALTVAWRVMPNASPPVYDGLCTADPYRLLGSNPAPESASKTYAATASFQTSEFTTSENPAQAQVLMTDGTFVSPDAPFTVSVTPVSPPAITPTDGQIDGNVYRLTAMTATGTPLQPQQPITLVLRATRSNPPRTMERFDGTAWKRLQTFSEGCGDTFEATTDRTDDFAMVANGQPPANDGGSGPPVAAIIAAAAVVMVAAILLLVRVNRSRAGRRD
jgi:hypothetical protein